MSINTKTSIPVSSSAAYWTIGISAAALLFLVSLHILSPEFDPSWHMVSEYANGNYGWVLSLMFAAWGLSSWILAFMLRPHVTTTAGKIGLVLLILAGIGEAMASVFDINHAPFHDLAGFIGIGSLPVAAMLISVNLSRTDTWSSARKPLLWTANLTWISVLLLIVSFIAMVVTFIQTGGDMNTTEVPTTLPAGVIGLVGWTNRFLIVTYCAWVITVGWQAIRIYKKTS